MDCKHLLLKRAVKFVIIFAMNTVKIFLKKTTIFFILAQLVYVGKIMTNYITLKYLKQSFDIDH